MHVHALVFLTVCLIYQPTQPFVLHTIICVTNLTRSSNKEVSRCWYFLCTDESWEHGTEWLASIDELKKETVYDSKTAEHENFLFDHDDPDFLGFTENMYSGVLEVSNLTLSRSLCIVSMNHQYFQSKSSQMHFVGIYTAYC